MENHMTEKSIIELLEEVSISFANNEENKGYSLLLKVIPMIEQISQSMIAKEGENPLLSALQPLLEGMENQDTWMMSEVIQYDIIPILKKYGV